jgi:hypothetical protein
MDLGIVVVNYKTASLTIACLESLELECSKGNYSVIVIDNNSLDDSFSLIESAIYEHGWSAWAKVIAAELNGGFSYGNNIAIRHYFASNDPPEFICLLNPDTYIRTGAMYELVRFMHDNPKVGICGSRLESPDGTGQLSSFKFHSWISELNRGFGFGLLTRLLTRWVTSTQIPENAVKTDWVSGASMMIRSTVFENIGLLDESYFMYYEETDFCFNAALSGWDCWYVPSSKVVHLVGQSSGITGKSTARRMPEYWFNSRRRYFLKNNGIIYAVLADFCWLVGLSTWKLRNLIQRKSDNSPPFFLRDGVRNSIFFKGFRMLETKNDL